MQEAGRGTAETLKLPKGGEATLVDDAYNANPESMRAAIEGFAARPGRKIVALGEMRELGPDAASIHEDAGRAARAVGIDRLYTLGAMAGHAADGYGEQAQRFEQIDDLVAALRDGLDEGVTVLVKGSRGARMERVVTALTGAAVEGAH